MSCLCVECLQNRTEAEPADNPSSSLKQVLLTGPSAGPVNTAPAVIGRHRSVEPPLQTRQPIIDELSRPNPDELVLGFRRHRMNQQALPASLLEKPLSARQVIMIYFV